MTTEHRDNRMATVEYDLTTYRHQQFWALVRDLTADGWTVDIRATGEPRPPNTPSSPGGYGCEVWNAGWNVVEHRVLWADTPWLALRWAVLDVIMPAYTGVYHGR